MKKINKKIEYSIAKDVKNFLSPKKEIDYTTTKDIKNLFILKKEIDYTTVKDIKNRSRLEKENVALKDRINKDIRKLLDYEQNYCIPVRVGNFWSSNYIKYNIKYKVTVIETKHYQLKNIVIEIDYT